jgi:hypothetical protein
MTHFLYWLVLTVTKDASLSCQFLKWTEIKNRFLKIKIEEFISRRCRRGGAVIAAGAVVEEPMPLDEMSKR